MYVTLQHPSLCQGSCKPQFGTDGIEISRHTACLLFSVLYTQRSHKCSLLMYRDVTGSTAANSCRFSDVWSPYPPFFFCFFEALNSQNRFRGYITKPHIANSEGTALRFYFNLWPWRLGLWNIWWWVHFHRRTRMSFYTGQGTVSMPSVLSIYTWYTKWSSEKHPRLLNGAKAFLFSFTYQLCIGVI